nr:zinc finger, CCHC-type, retrotransposon Gag domain protein [Tanacetum cinerariifolium]
MVNTRTDADLFAAVQNALQTLLPQIREEIREEFRTGSGSSNAGGNPPQVTIHRWLERFNKQKPHSFEKATAPVDAENWISDMEKIFDVMGYEDEFKTRLAVYKFEGNALAWGKAYKQAKGGDAWLVTVTWADFKKLFFLQFFPRAEQERLKRETRCRLCFHIFAPRFARSFVQVPDRQMLVEIPHRLLFTRGLNALTSRSLISFEKATVPVDAENWISHMEKIFDVMGCEDAFKTRLAVYKFEGNALAWWKAYKQAKGGDTWLVTVTWADFKKSTLNHLMCMSYTDVAQVANAARNYEILHERDDEDTERPDKRQRSGDRHQPTSQQSSHRSHGHNNDRHGSDRRGGSNNHRSINNNNYSGSNN